MCIKDFINVLNGYCTISVQIAQNNNECIYIGLAMELEKEEILEECKKIKPDAITSIGSDLAVITVNYVANALGLNCNNPEYSLICTNKFEMRKAFEKANIKIPRFEKVKSIDEVTINKFPLIVKPTDRSGSRSIALVHSKEELENAILKACESSFEKYEEGKQ